jgi:hypothetical protein
VGVEVLPPAVAAVKFSFKRKIDFTKTKPIAPDFAYFKLCPKG